PMFWVTNDMGYHSKTWPSLTYQYNLNRSVGSARFRQSCTDKLKVKVVDKFVESYIKEIYGFTGDRKQAYYRYFEKFGKMRLILGFSAEEASRTSNGSRFDPVWKKKNVQRYHPLIEDGTS